MKKIGFTILLLGLSCALFGQEHLDSVEITDRSLLGSSLNYKNQSAFTIDKASIAKLPYQTLDALLKQIPGLDVRTRGMNGVQSDMSIDGGTFDQCLILLNGHPLSDPQTGHNLLSLPISTLGIASIEIIKGPVASLYGVNALSGLINIITTTQNAEQIVQVSLGTGALSNNSDSFYANYGLQLRSNVQWGKVSNTIHLGYDQGNGYRPNTAYKILNAFTQSDYTQNGWNIGWQTGYKYADFGASGFYAYPGDSLSSETIHHLLTGVTISKRISDRLKLATRLSYNYKSDDYWYLSTPDVGRNVHDQHNIHALMNIQYQSPIGTFNIALTHRNEQLKSTNLGVHNRTFTGLIAHYHHLLAQKILVEGTLNNNYYNQKMHWYPAIGIGYFIKPQHKIYANAGTAERLPSFTDLYYSLPNVIIGNPKLIAEKAINVAIGYQWKTALQQFHAYYFNRKVDHFIDWVKMDVNNAWQPQNYHQVTTSGMTILWRQQLEQNMKSCSDIYYTLGYNLLNPQLRLTEENVLSRYAINALKHQLTASLGSKIGAHWQWNVNARYNDRIAYQSYWILDAKVGYRLPKHSINLVLNNATNTQIIEAGANPIVGRWLNMNYQFHF